MEFDEIKRRMIPSGEARDELTERVIGAAIEVHRILRPGLSELFYEAALCAEFELRGIKYVRQFPIPVTYKGVVIGETRLDLVVEDQLIVELKACEGLNALHRSQCITYLAVSKLKVALLINFNVAVLRDGIKRVSRTK